ncbi:hypothetical protein [Natronococcus wangiae]|uniref:hypothetical protein n=1 Tax=Natronococcus wangiae TaxID=3068275 RepID=UPI00273FD41C|nr:hypothetical protein [Natronococcus sp. AD5]
MTVEFQTDRKKHGITVLDRTEKRQFPLLTDRPVSLESGTASAFQESVDAVIESSIQELVLPYVVPVFVRDANGETVAECNDFAREELPAAEYELEIAAPIKLFMQFSGSATITSSSDEMRIRFDGTTHVDLAAQSYYEGPTVTITTTEDPVDMMAAVSTFGSALDTTSPERSFPSRRGYPPAVTLGETLTVPNAVEPLGTGITVEVPPNLPAIYTVATLAYYLGAEVVPGSEACLLADGEIVKRLEPSEERRESESGRHTSAPTSTNRSKSGFEEAVAATLQQIFLLDCVVRIEGKYPVDLHERRQLTERIDLPLSELYEAPISDRVTRYLQIPSADVLDLVPTWQLSTYLSPKPSSVEAVPYAVNALSFIHVMENPPAERQSSDSAASAPPGYESFIRDSSNSAVSAEGGVEPTHVRVPAATTLEQAWFGDGRSVNANDLHLGGIRNRFVSESSDGSIEIGVVCNDTQMVPEIDDGELYGDRKELPFTVSIYRDLTCDELRDLLETDLDFLHYIGHVDQTGFVCRDGAVETSELDTVGVNTFFLNGCRSYEQGQALVERGSVGGIVTVSAIGNENAIPVGRLVARLLNAGFSLRSSLAITDQYQPVNNRYTIVGDGGAQIAQSENGTPNVLQIEQLSDGDGYEVRIATYPTTDRGMGSCYTPYAPSMDRYFLAGGELPPFTLSLPEVVNLLALEGVPAIVNGEFQWSTDVELSDLSLR